MPAGAKMSVAKATDRTCPLVVGLIGAPGAQTRRITRVLSLGGLGSPVRAESLPESSEGWLGAVPDVLLIALSRNNGDVVETVSGARATFPGIPLIGIWQSDLAGDQPPALRLGVDGVVIADQLERTLVPTVRAVAAGLVCVPRALRRELKRENLSGREKQILGMVVTGSTNAEIASRLFLAESTVKSHLSSAYEKLGVRSRRDAAALILDPAIGLDRGILAISAA